MFVCVMCAIRATDTAMTFAQKRSVSRCNVHPLTHLLIPFIFSIYLSSFFFFFFFVRQFLFSQHTNRFDCYQCSIHTKSDRFSVLFYYSSSFFTSSFFPIIWMVFFVTQKSRMCGMTLPARFVSAALYCWFCWWNKRENMDGQRWRVFSISVACKHTTTNKSHMEVRMFVADAPVWPLVLPQNQETQKKTQLETKRSSYTVFICKSLY